ncbi:MarR family winged helix-turn-helix transcriptional regulator [Phenylobacterium sp.]|uniref:MarR family winged helix-turn-helix transcriptional regulator n=1 Tax=Phenylobacterium sp. TaxID=1871053 RepID=UPI002DEC78D7|nr:MarR family transcriptional regulator [Phenylobacterium sp.]
MASFFAKTDLAGRLQRLVFRLNRELRLEFAELGVTGADAAVLFDLRRRPGCGVTELAAMSEVGRSVMSERIKRLEAAGLVERDAGPRTDRRRVGLSVTRAGLSVMVRIARERRNRLAVRLDRLDEAQRHAIEAAISALERLPDWKSAAEMAGQQTLGTGEDDHGPRKAQSA